MKIIYLVQQLINNTMADRIKEISPQYDHEALQQVFKPPLHPCGFYNRKGRNSLPFNTNTDLIMPVPDLDKNFKKTFVEITDQRSVDLVKNYKDRPWILFWSGGIDSTAMVVSLLKNLSKGDLENVKIACNNLSVYEHPTFFYNHVLPNFDIISATELSFIDLLDTHYIVGGDPADMLFGASQSYFAHQYGLNLTDSWKQEKPLMNFLSSLLGDSSAKWLYEAMRCNLESLSGDALQIETYADWFWWINFNWKFTSVSMALAHGQVSSNLLPFFENVINWYVTPDYQQWSMMEGRYSCLRNSPIVSNQKKISKQYIFDYDKNPYALKFKSKICSNSRGPISGKSNGWFCLLDDYTTLTLEKDLDLILELLPAHINKE